MSDWRPLQRIGLAAAFSAVAHAAVITLGRIDIPQRQPDLPPLAVRITSVASADAPDAPRNPGPRARRAAPAVTEAAVAPAPAPPALAPEVLAEAATAPAEEVATPAPPVSAAVPEPVAPAAERAPALTAEARPLPAFPRRGRITFNLVYGREQFPVGQTVQTWQVDGARYQLASRSETSGLADLLRSQHRTYLSRGALTENGLRPDTFLMSRDRGRGRAIEEARAQFDWKNGTVVLGPASSRREQALPHGSQDLVSFMYQLAIDPPPAGRLRLSVTNGTRFESYRLDVLPEEKMETPIGELRVLPIRQMRTAGEESIDLWLATEYRHLPVRIRFYDRDGKVAGEQIVSEIRLSDD